MSLLNTCHRLAVRELEQEPSELFITDTRKVVAYSECLMALAINCKVGVQSPELLSCHCWPPEQSL